MPRVRLAKVPVADLTVDLAVDQATLFDFVVAPENRPRWQASLRAVTDLEPGAEGPGTTGTTWRDVTVVPGMRPTLRVTDYQRPGHWAETGAWWIVTADLRLELSPIPTGTRVRAQAVLGLPVLITPLGALLRLLTPAALRSDLRRAARLLKRR